MKTEFIIKRKLETSILPYILTGDTLRQSLDWRLYHGYSYTKEILPLLSGVGISFPVLGFIQGVTLPEKIPVGALSTFGILIAILLGFLRIRAGKEDLMKKILGQKKIIRQLKSIEFKTNNALSNDDATLVLAELTEIQKEIIAIWNSGIQEDQLEGGFSADTLARAAEKCKELLTRFGKAEWSNIDLTEVNSSPDQRA